MCEANERSRMKHMSLPNCNSTKKEEAGPGSVMWFYTNHLHNNVLWNVSEPRMRKEERISKVIVWSMAKENYIWLFNFNELC